MADNTHHRSLSAFTKRNGENGHPILSNRLSRAEYDELRGNGTTEQGSNKISEPSSLMVEGGTGGADGSMPNEGEIEKRFENLLEKLTLDPDQVTDLQRHPIQHKWKLIQAKEMVEPKHSSQFYVTQLQRHMDEALQQHAKPPKKLIKNLEPKEVILRSLEVDVRTHPNTTWLREFLEEPYNGHQVLIDFMAFLHKNPPPPPSPEQEQKKSQRSSKSGKRRKKVMARSHADEHMCLMCLKALMRNKFGFKSAMAVKDALVYVVLCLQIDNIKTKILAIKLLYAACANDKYHHLVIEALEYYRTVTKEHQMFFTLVNFLYVEPVQPGLQAVTMALLNAIVNNSPSYNDRVFHQQQIVVAGFSEQHLEKTLEGLDATPVRDELKIWRENYVNIQDLMDEYVQLKERSQLLRDEVDLLSGKLEDVQREKNEVERQKKEFEEKAEDFRFRATELQNALEKVMKTHNKDDINASLLEPLTADPPPPPPPAPPPPPGGPPPPPPFPGSGVPAPPPPPPGFKGPIQAGSKRKVVSKKKLPMLNWAPVTNTQKTIFESMDDEKLAVQLNLGDFEAMFELRTNQMSEEVRLKKEAALKKLAEQITIIETNRARNLVIAKRRIGFSPKHIKQHIDNSDISELSSEFAELLLKFVPTKEELAGLSKHADDYEKLAEAEQFMFELAKVKRYEAKLGVVAFVGLFDEVMSAVVPKIDAVLRASLSILNNKKLKKIFEIILAFGNYMNGTRKKVAAGFKLESLYKLPDVRSTDRKMSLLNFVVTSVKTHFPELHSFAEGLHIEDATQVSKQTLNNDIQSLKKGIDLTKKERDKQPDNFILFSFYNRAFGKVQKVSEKYRKMEERYTEVCQMFGEDGKKIEPSEFFRYFQDFVTMYFKAESENEERKKQEEARRQAEILMRNQKNKAKTLPSIETAWNYTNDSDAYDDEDDDSTSGSGGSDSS